MNKIFCFSKKRIPAYIALCVLIAISAGAKIVICVLSKQGKFIYFGTIISDNINMISLYALIIFFGSFILLILNNKIIKIITIVVCVVIIAFKSLFSGGFWEAEKKYFEYESPDYKTIIVEECSWLLGGWSNVYFKESEYIIKKLDGHILTDDGYRPFSSNDFHLEWEIGSLTITYGFGNAGIKKSETFKFQ